MNPDLEEKLSALIDGELAPIEEVELRAELERSPELRQRLSELEAVGQALRALPAQEASPELHGRLRQRLEAEPDAASARHPLVSAPPPRRRRALQWAAAGAAAAAISAFVLLNGPTPTAEDDPEFEELFAALLEEELDEAVPAAATDEDLEVIELLDLLAALELEATSG